MAKVAKTAGNVVDADQAVLDLLKKVAAKKEEIKKAKTRPSWKTNCVFTSEPGVTSSYVCNIQVVREVRKLIEIQAHLNTKEAAMKQAAEELGVEFDGTWQGFAIEDWKEDIKTRIEQLQLDKNEKELEELDARVNKLVSPEQRREMELKALMEILK